jgi:hypothetical protein
MNVNIYNTTDYENKSNWTIGQNKPNSNPIKPNFKKAQMNVNSLITKDYRKKDDFTVRINKPNSNPISKMPKMSANVYVIEDYENEPPSGPKKTNPNKANFLRRHGTAILTPWIFLWYNGQARRQAVYGTPESLRDVGQNEGASLCQTILSIGAIS